MSYIFIFFAWVFWLAFLSVLGITCGVRKLYVHLLLYTFNICREGIRVNIKKRWRSDSDPNSAGGVIDRSVIHSPSEIQLKDANFKISGVHTFQLSDIIPFCVNAVEAIVQDDCTSRFQAEEIPSWNILTRTEIRPEFISWKMEIIWFIGCIFRYCILVPIRIVLLLCCFFFFIVGNYTIARFVTDTGHRKKAYKILMESTMRILMRAFSAVIRFHNREYKAKSGGICVANHTSPIDIFVLGSDNTYAMVGQKQPGIFGFFQDIFNQAESHVWFNRAEASDRAAVSRRLREHVSDKTKLPILIFPEGTCINNTSVMMFKKGSFETGGVIYPVAIKYDSRFADPFWNSSECNVLMHVFRILTSWSLVCDVRYLPPQTIQENENAIVFANRVKSEIAHKGGLVDLEWDGMLKRSRPSQKIVDKAKEDYSHSLSLDSDSF